MFLTLQPVTGIQYNISNSNWHDRVQNQYSQSTFTTL